MSEFRRKLTEGFKIARRHGYFARQNWKCCQSCGCAALPDGTINYVFYHAQDAECIRDAEKRARPAEVSLAWGGDGAALRECFREAGLMVEWNGSPGQRLKVSMPARRSDRTLAVQLEHLGPDGALPERWRAILFMFDHEEGLAVAEEIAEGADPEDVVSAACASHAPEPIAVKVEGREVEPMAEQVTPHHWVVWPAALTLAKTAELLAVDRRPHPDREYAECFEAFMAQ